jgi:hypothetical protein
MKKIIGLSLGALVAAVTFPASAALNDAMSGTSVWVRGHWDEPSNERFIYAVKPAVAPFVGETYFVEPDNDFNFAFGLEYAIPMSEADTHFSAVLDYDQYSTSQNDVKSGVLYQTVIGSGAPFNAAGANNDFRGDVHLRDHTWRLGVRRSKEFGRFDWQLGAFAEYSKVARTYSILEANGAAGNQLYTKQESDGWGPSLDMMGRLYPWGRDTGFSVFGTGETAFLYADQTFAVIHSTGGVLNATSDANRADLNAVMVRLGATVGVGYARPISEDLVVGFKVGGRWLNYHNAFKSSSNLTVGRNDYGRMGPFVELRVGGTHSPM